MARFKLTLEYVGTRYRGWQRQPGVRTVEAELRQALRDALGKEAFELHGAGRTDAGVHALGQVADLELGAAPDPERLRRALNDALPADIHVLALQPAPPRFRSRFDAEARVYLYQIARRRTAFAKALVWWVRDPLDAGAMRAAGQRLVGLHDFRAFSADDPEEKSTRVELQAIEVAEAGALLLVRLRASHFLWKMARRIVGVLAEAGRGRMDVEAVARLLVAPSPQVAALTAPPSGLFLERVVYPGDPPDGPLRPVIELAGEPAPVRARRPRRAPHRGRRQ